MLTLDVGLEPELCLLGVEVLTLELVLLLLPDDCGLLTEGLAVAEELGLLVDVAFCLPLPLSTVVVALEL